MGSKKVLLMGASGMIGNLILEECIQSESIRELILINRKILEIKSTKVQQIVHSDFEDYAQIGHYFKDLDICYYCLGVYTGQVSNEELEKITVQYPFSLAKEIIKFSKNCHFVLLSGEGADRTERSIFPFAKFKGCIENKLLSLGFKKVYCCRPGYIFPEKPRKEPNWTYAMIRKCYKLVQKVIPGFGIRSGQLAKAMFNIGMSDLNKDIFSNQDLKKYSLLT